MSVRDTILRFLVQATGEKELQKVVKEIQETGTSADGAEKKVAGFLDELAQSKKLQDAVKSYGDLRKKILELQSQYTAAKKNVADLGKAITDSEKPTKRQVAELEKSRGALKRLGDQIDQNKGRYRALGAELTAAGLSTSRMAATTSQLQARASAATAGINSLADSLRRAKAQAEGFKLGDDQFRRMAQSTTTSANALAAYRERTRQAAQGNAQLNQSTGVLSGSMGRLKILLGGLGAAFTFQGIGRGVGAMLGFADTIERTTIAFRSMYKTSYATDQAMSQLQTVARKNSLAFTDVLAAARRLKSFGLEPLDGSLQALIDQNAVLGGTQEGLMGSILAVGQAWTKQKLQGEEVLQLAERGIPVWDRLARATGKSVPELQKLSTAGKLGRDEIKLLLDQIGKETMGAAGKNVDLLSSRFVALRDRLQQFFLAVSNSGALQYFKDELRKVVQAVDAMIADGRFERYAKQLSDLIIGTASALKSTVTFVVEYRNALFSLALAYGAVKVAGFIGSLARVRTELALTAAATRGLGAAALAQTAAGGGLSQLTKFILSVPRLIKFTIIGVGAEIALYTLRTTVDLMKQIQLEGVKQEIAQARLASATADLNFKIAQTKAIYREASLSAVISLDTVASATRNQLEQYELNLQGAVKYYRAVAVEAKRAGDASSLKEAQVQLAKLPGLIQAVQTRLEVLTEAALKTGSRFSELSVKATIAFDEIIQKGQSAKQAVDNIFKDFDLGDKKGLKGAIDTLEQVGARGKDAAEQIQKEFSASIAKLSDEDFKRFQEAAKTAFKEGTQGAKALQKATENINLKRLGLDAAEIKSGMTNAASSAISAFKAAGQEVDKLGLTVDQKTRAMSMAFDEAFKSVNSKKELEALAAALQQAMASGDISFVQFRDRIEQVKVKLAELAAQGSGVGSSIAAGANQASSSLDQLGDSASQAADGADKAAEGIDEAGKSSKKADQSIESVSFSLAAISEQAVAAYRDTNRYAGLWGIWNSKVNAVTHEVERQAEAVKNRTESIRQEMAKFDTDARRRSQLTSQYNYLAASEIEGLLQAEKELNDFRQRAADERARKEQEEADARKARSDATKEKLGGENGPLAPFNPILAPQATQSVKVFRIELPDETVEILADPDQEEGIERLLGALTRAQRVSSGS